MTGEPAYQRANRTLWNEFTEIHANSAFYDVEAFKAGRNRLHPLEMTELGEVRGKSLLHLQCHFGLDTLSWARMGAEATGVDLSEKAITLAESLSQECHIPARFVRSDIYGLPNVLDGTFDIVYTSYGVLCWLPDLAGWAKVAAHYLAPGGTFYMAEYHPFANIFDNSAEATGLRISAAYFDQGPFIYQPGVSYADPDTPVKAPEAYEWQHTMGEILSALTGAGLRLEFLHEFPYTNYQALPFLIEDGDRRWTLPDKASTIPLMFSIRARKDEE